MKKTIKLIIISALSFILISCNNTKKQSYADSSLSSKNNRNIKTFFLLSSDESKKAVWVECISNKSQNTPHNQNEAKTNTDEFTLEKAIAMAKAEYGEDDIEYHYDSDGLKETNGKKYYVIIPRSKSMRQAGGTGTLTTLRVFEDGNIEDVSNSNERFN